MRFKRILLSILFILAFFTLASAQNISTTTCPGNGCIDINTVGQGSIGIQITGTWVGTVTFQASIGTQPTSTFVSLLVVPSNSTTAVTTTTGNGAWSLPIAGFNQVRVVFTAYTSGTAVVNWRITQQAKNNLPPPAGVGTVTSVGLTAPNGFTITGSPVTGSGSLGITTTDPNADRIWFWDDSANSFAYLTPGTNLSITGTTLDAASSSPPFTIGDGDPLAMNSNADEVIGVDGNGNPRISSEVASGTLAIVTVTAQDGLSQNQPAIKISSPSNSDIGLGILIGQGALAGPIDIKPLGTSTGQLQLWAGAGGGTLNLYSDSAHAQVSLGEDISIDAPFYIASAVIGVGNRLINISGGPVDNYIHIGDNDFPELSITDNVITMKAAAVFMSPSSNEEAVSITAGGGFFGGTLKIMNGEGVAASDYGAVLNLDNDRPTLSAQGNDDNISLDIVAKGTGTINLNSATIGTSVTSRYIANGATPSVSDTSANSCGTGTETIVGNDNAGKVTVIGSVGTSCTVTFAAAFANAPSCSVTNEITANLSRCTTTTTTAIIAGVFNQNDVLSYIIMGR